LFLVFLGLFELLTLPFALQGLIFWHVAPASTITAAA
jgi:hypothetical protein